MCRTKMLAAVLRYPLSSCIDRGSRICGKVSRGGEEGRETYEEGEHGTRKDAEAVARDQHESAQHLDALTPMP